MAVIASTAYFEAPYNPKNGRVTRPRMDPTLITRPARFARNTGSVARITLWTPNTFTSNKSRACSAVNPSESPADAMPALLTTTSSLLPDFSRSCTIALSTLAWSVTSTLRISILFALSSSAICFLAPSAERNPANTLCPDFESVSAVRRPKPLDAPVTKIVFAIVLGFLTEEDSLPTLAPDACIWGSLATSSSRVWMAPKSRRCQIWRKSCQIHRREWFSFRSHRRVLAELLLCGYRSHKEIRYDQP